MALEPGACLGHYEIQAPIGAGGMGEVYRAFDTHLGRPVAIKVLPELFARDAERLARLEREARALASLNHPNIATLHGFEERSGVRFLVMELVEGETLATAIARRAPRLEKGSLRNRPGSSDDDRRAVSDALAIGEQIADALAAAHEQGIIHRDLKPSNVMLSAGGRVKVLDFGLAKTLRPSDAAESKTATAELAHTTPQTQMGTLPYMSPAQIRGEPLDGRADIWALGCVLYELLVGTPAFDRATPADTIAAILGEAPDLDRLPASTPARIRLLIERCLSKDAHRRIHHAADARLELADARSELTGEVLPNRHSRSPAPGPTARWWVSGLLAAVGLAAIAATAVIWLGRGHGGETVSSGVVTFSVPLPDGVAIGPAEVTTFLAVSPDGEHLVFAGNSGRAPLQLHSFRDATTRLLVGTEGAESPFWSPDGRFMAFFGEGRLKKVNIVDGGPPQVVSTANWEAGSSWNAAGVMLFAQPAREGIAIHQVSSDGGEPSPVTEVDSEREVGHFWPHFLPDGRRFLYLAIEKPRGETHNRTLYAASLDGGERRAIPGVASRALYVPPGFLLYVSEGVLVARPFSAERAEFTGDPTPIAEQLRHFYMTGQAEFSVSQGTGRSVLAFHGGPWRNELVVYDRTGTRLRTVGKPAAYHHVRISPDGEQLAVSVLDPANGGRDLWVYALETGRARRLTLHAPDERNPVWSPDGRRIAFRSDVNGPPDLYVQDASGGGEAAVILSTPTVLDPEDWSKDGRYVLYQVDARATGNDQWLLSLDGGAPPRPLLNTRYSEWSGRFSPDGRWVTFVSDESGVSHIYVAPVDDPGARRVLSTTGGISPRWRADGREVFYLGPKGAVMAVPVDAGPDLTFGQPRMLFTVNTPIYFGAYDVSPDGQFFVVNHVVDDVTRSPITVVLNWAAGLRPAGRQEP